MIETDLAPWMLGPFELIKHAEGHFINAGDTDRRIAIIGFDNAIEVCIDVFIKLHPKLREGVELRKDDIQKATLNYHTKIEWLDKYIETKGLAKNFSIEEIVWYHSLRNELYHSGNGMIPEMHVIQGARIAAIEVFKALFKTDIYKYLDVKKDFSDKSVTLFKYEKKIPYYPDNDKMEFIRVYIEFEQALDNSLSKLFPNTQPKPISVTSKWELYKSKKEIPSYVDSTIRNAIEYRNKITHGRNQDTSTDAFNRAYVSLREMTNLINMIDNYSDTHQPS